MQRFRLVVCPSYKLSLKKIFVIIAILFSSQISLAQITIGVKGGFNISTIVNSNGFRKNFNIGALANFAIKNNFSLQTEIEYSGQGSEPALTGGSATSYLNLNYLNVPVLIKYKTSPGIFFETGPQAGLLLNAKSIYGNIKSDEMEKFTTADFSWAFGLGYISKFNFGADLRFNLGISNINKDYNNFYKYKNDVVQLSLFYQFKL